MSYLEEWKKIEKKYGNTAKELALMHIAKCLSVIADDIVGDCKECKEVMDEKPCNNCIHSNDEYEINCGVCDENHSEYKPFGFRGKEDEIEVACPLCTKIFTARKNRFTPGVLHLTCPFCNISFVTYV